MLKIEALEQLAVKVMGWKCVSSGFELVKPRLYWLDQLGVIRTEGGTPWHPFTDPVQALDLAEAWCKQVPRNGRFYIHRRTETGIHWVDLYGKDCHGASTTMPKLAEALTLAVCAAEEIEVDE